MCNVQFDNLQARLSGGGAALLMMGGGARIPSAISFYVQHQTVHTAKGVFFIHSTAANVSSNTFLHPFVIKIYKLKIGQIYLTHLFYYVFEC